MYYVFPIILDKKINRKKLFKILTELGMQGISEGYQLLHRLPMYNKKIAYGSKGFPWSLSKKNYNYINQNLIIAEELHHKTFLSFEICLFDLSSNDVKKIYKCFEYAWKTLKIV